MIQNIQDIQASESKPDRIHVLNPKSIVRYVFPSLVGPTVNQVEDKFYLESPSSLPVSRILISNC